jgi:glycosyltransferase involved in cell wall biosynthesis
MTGGGQYWGGIKMSRGGRPMPQDTIASDGSRPRIHAEQTDPEGRIMTRLQVDMSILRHPHAGTARYAVELLDAMQEGREPGDSIRITRGFPRAARGRRVLRYANAAGDLAWTVIGGRIAATRGGASIWYSPSNTLPANLGRPAVVTIHDLNFLSPDTQYDPKFRAYAERMFARSAGEARRVIADSEYTLNAMVDAFGIDRAKVSVAYPGLEHALRVSSGPRPPELPRRYALFVGQTEPHKNVGLLLDAWDCSVPGDLHLIVAGPPGRDHDSLLARAGRGKAPARIHLLGRVPDSLLATLYAEAECFLFPSLAEGFGFPPLEAMARGTVTAVAATTSLPEVTADGAVHFDPHDPTALADLVTRLTEDDAFRAGLISRGRSVAGRYRWPTTASIVWAAVRAAESET